MKHEALQNEIVIREYEDKDLEQITAIWNEVVEEGIAFPQKEPLTPSQAVDFFAAQDFTGVAEKEGQIYGLYILHPNNIGRCGHIGNASYAVASKARGMGVGGQLVSDSLRQAEKLGFGILQFNAVVSTNTGAIALYKKLGFVELGTIPAGFLKKDGTYEDIILFYHTLSSESTI